MNNSARPLSLEAQLEQLNSICERLERCNHSEAIEYYAQYQKEIAAIKRKLAIRDEIDQEMKESDLNKAWRLYHKCQGEKSISELLLEVKRVRHNRG